LRVGGKLQLLSNLRRGKSAASGRGRGGRGRCVILLPERERGHALGSEGGRERAKALLIASPICKSIGLRLRAKGAGRPWLVRCIGITRGTSIAVLIHQFPALLSHCFRTTSLPTGRTSCFSSEYRDHDVTEVVKGKVNHVERIRCSTSVSQSTSESMVSSDSFKLSSLLSTERPALRIRKTREEKRPATLFDQCAQPDTGRRRPPLFCLPFLHPFFFLSDRRLSRLECQYVVSSIPLFLLSSPLTPRPPQGHAKPNDWPSNISRPHSCCRMQIGAPGVMPPGPPIYP
jgi:hypothetical protein